MKYRRLLYNTLKEQLESKEMVVVTGLRRSGKTTLLKMLFDDVESDNKVFLDVDNPLEQMVFEEKDYNNVWGNLSAYGVRPDKRAYVFLDEIQTFPEIVKPLKYLFDHYDVKFFVTGSSSYYLKNLFPESLAGRKFEFTLYPLNFEEFLGFKGVNFDFGADLSYLDKNKNKVSYEKLVKYYDEYMLYGGFPQVVLTNDNKQKVKHLKDIFKSYFEKDVASLADVRKLSSFRDMMLLLMQRVGSRLDVTKLASELALSRDTVYSYLNFLQGTYFLDLVPPYTNSRDKEVSNAKKVFFCDTGFLSHFAKVSEGSLLENAVYLNLRKREMPYYYQKRSGREIDFVLPLSKTALEVKRTGQPADLGNLRQMSRDLRLSNSHVVTYNFNDSDGFFPALSL